MRYYVKDPEDQAITGPFEIDELKAKLKAGELAADTLATGDIGEGISQIRRAPPEDWMPVVSIAGLSQERLATSETSPTRPPPLPPPTVAEAPHPTGSEMAFCPACGHKLSPDAGSACDRCGHELIAFRHEPVKLLEIKPEPLLLKPAVSAAGGCLSAIGVILMFMGILFLIGFLLLLIIMCRCKA